MAKTRDDIQANLAPVTTEQQSTGSTFRDSFTESPVDGSGTPMEYVDDWSIPAHESRYTLKQKAVAVASGVIAAAGLVFGVSKIGGGEDTHTVPVTDLAPGSPKDDTPPEKAPVKTGETLVASNICDVINENDVMTILGVTEQELVSRQCFSSLDQGLLTEVDWASSSGVVFAVSVLDDAKATATTVHNPDGSVSGFMGFDEFSTSSALQRFSLTLEDGREYQAAANSNELRVKVGAYVLDIIVMSDQKYVQSGSTLAAAPDITGTSLQQFQIFASSVVERGFSS